MSLVVMSLRKLVLAGPLTSHTPMCVTSNTPALVRTAVCSSLTLVYQTGISYPANGTIFARRTSLCSVCSDVVLIGASVGSRQSKRGNGCDFGPAYFAPFTPTK